MSPPPPLPGGQRGPSRSRRIARTRELLERLTVPGTPRREVEDEIIRLNVVVATQEARRYERRGIDAEDLRQVACLALVRAVRHYDPGLATDFLGYVVPCIRGELRRSFRDTGWTVRPPRSVQELQAQVTRVTEDLAHELGRSPRPSDIADRLGVTVERVEEAVAAHGGFTADSLDDVADASGRPLVESLVHHEAGYAQVEARLVVAPAVRSLGVREQQILEMRYLHDATQDEIGARIGVTQAQVSRLMSGLNKRLRGELAARTGEAPPDLSRAG